MSEEEKKAIEQVKKLLENANPFTMQPYIYFSLEKVLNIIEKQNKELDIVKTNYEILQGEVDRIGIDTLKLEKGSSTDDIIEEIEIKDKMIDLMSEQLAEIKIWDYKKDTNILKVKEEVKEQFRKKVENERICNI